MQKPDRIPDLIITTSIEYTLLSTRLLIKMNVKHIIPYLYTQQSSWRWTLGFETSRRPQKIKLLIWKRYILLVYIV